MIEDKTLFGNRDTAVTLSEILYVVIERNTGADVEQVQTEATRIAKERFKDIGE